MKLNFTGKNTLSDKEFIQYYDELWERTPHYNLNWPSNEKIKQLKKAGENKYNSTSEKLFPNEEWEEFPDNPQYIISSEGRVKFDNKFIRQDDKYEDKPGYLVLSPLDKLKINRSREVYTFVAMTFMGKKEGDGLHVHHINNNGYDCSTENLILLTKKQHNAVHLDQKLSFYELTQYLNDNYNEAEVKLHLTNYKINNLNINESGYWQNRKKYSHILPENKKIKNLISVSYKTEFQNLYQKYEKDLHDYFAHLSSSQALCFNLFYPLAITGRFDIIDKSISSEANSCFEHTESKSFEAVLNKKQKTNFDFFIEDKNKKFFFELKYTEQGFGSVAGVKENDAHDKKYKEYYKKQMKKITKEEISEEDFFDNYQLWRNVCHSDIGIVYFVILKCRKSLEKEINNVRNKCKDEYKSNIEIIYIEKLVQKCLKIKDEKLHKHYQEFYEKYLNY